MVAKADTITTIGTASGISQPHPSCRRLFAKLPA